MTLDQIKLNNSAVVSLLNCSGDIKRRILDLGVVPGTTITPVLDSSSGNIRAYEIRGSLIGLRKQDSKNIVMGAQ